MTRKKNNKSKQATQTVTKEVIVKHVPVQQTKRIPRIKISSSKNPIFGSNNFTSNVDHIPAAFNTISGNSTFLREAGKVKHPMIGIEGIALVGCQPLTDIVTTAATSAIFSTGTLATALANSIALSPDALNGPLAAQANLHLKYVFRDVILEYVSNVATSQAGSMALAVSEDGANLSFPTSFSEVRQIIPSVSFPFRSDHCYLHYHYDGLQLWMTEIDSATTAGLRSTVQGTICGFPSASSIGAITQGYLNVWFNIELYQPVQSQGFTFLLKSKEERDMVEQYVAELRREKKTDKKVGLEPKPLDQFFRRIN